MKYRVEHNTHTHYVASRLQNISPSTGKYSSGRENRWSHTRKTHSMTSCNWWIGTGWYLSKQTGSKWTGKIKEMSAHFIEMFWWKEGLQEEKERWVEIHTKVGNSDKPDETSCWKNDISHDLRCQKCCQDLTYCRIRWTHTDKQVKCLNCKPKDQLYFLYSL